MTIPSPSRPTSSVATAKPARKFSKARRSGTASPSAKPKPTFALPPKPEPAKLSAPSLQAPKHAVPPPPPQAAKHAVPPKPQPVKHDVLAPPPQSVKHAVPAPTPQAMKLAVPAPPLQAVKHAVPPPPKSPTAIVSSSKTTPEIPKRPIIEKANPPAKRKAYVIALPGQAQSIPQPKTKVPTKRRSSFANTKTKVRNSVLVTTKTPIAEAAAAAATANSLPFFAEETLPVPHPDSFVKPKNHQSRLLVHSFGKRGDPSLNMPKLQLSFDKGPFTERERRAIKAAVISFLAEHNIDTKHAYEFVDSKRRRSEFGDQFKKFYPSLIATSGVNRTCEQVYRYLRDVLLNENHERAGESWTPEEDAQLTELFEIHGGRWRKISSAMGRVGCRERYRYLEEFMQPHIRKGEWYPEEETRLIHLVLKHHQPKRLPSGTLQDPSSEAWVSIALEFHTRTIAQIKEKFFYTDLRARWILAWNAMHPKKEGSNGSDGESDSAEEEEDVEGGSGDVDESESEGDSKTDGEDTDEDTEEDTEEEGTGKKSSQSTASRKRKRATTSKSKPINLQEFDKKFDESSVNFKWSRDLDLQLLQGMKKQKKAHDEAELNWKLLLVGTFTIWPVERLKARWLVMRSRATQYNATCQSAYSEDPSSTPPPRPPSPTMHSHVNYLINNYDSIYKPSAKSQRKKNREVSTVHYPSAEHVEDSEEESLNEDTEKKGEASASDDEMSSVEREEGKDDEEQSEVPAKSQGRAVSSNEQLKTANSPVGKKRKAAEDRESEKAEPSKASKKVKLGSKLSSKTKEDGPAAASKDPKNGSKNVRNKKNANGAKPVKS
ncbi:hypothetical protein BJ741DRAFT_591531, partial [Chytriomyces cf. hyalinus JEL632]